MPEANWIQPADPVGSFTQGLNAALALRNMRLRQQQQASLQQMRELTLQQREQALNETSQRDIDRNQSAAAALEEATRYHNLENTAAENRVKTAADALTERERNDQVISGIKEDAEKRLAANESERAKERADAAAALKSHQDNEDALTKQLRVIQSSKNNDDTETTEEKIPAVEGTPGTPAVHHWFTKDDPATPAVAAVPEKTTRTTRHISPADALTQPVQTPALPNVAPVVASPAAVTRQAIGGYKIGGTYAGGMKYLGGDPNDPTSWGK